MLTEWPMKRGDRSDDFAAVAASCFIQRYAATSPVAVRHHCRHRRLQQALRPWQTRSFWHRQPLPCFCGQGAWAWLVQRPHQRPEPLRVRLFQPVQPLRGFCAWAFQARLLVQRPEALLRRLRPLLWVCDRHAFWALLLRGLRLRPVRLQLPMRGHRRLFRHGQIDHDVHDCDLLTAARSLAGVGGLCA